VRESTALEVGDDLCPLRGALPSLSAPSIAYDQYVQHLLPEADVFQRATHVRSTLLQTSLRMVKSIGSYERWLASVDPLHRDMIIESVAPTWLPIEVGLAHYLACDTFGLDDPALDQIGQTVGEQLQSTWLSAATKMLRTAGITSQAAVRFGRFWPRICQGGGLQIALLGPKELNIALCDAVLPRSRYFRGTFVGNVRVAFKLLGTGVLYVKPLPYDEKNDRFTVRVSYV
jgi:hypothetical protein